MPNNRFWAYTWKQKLFRTFRHSWFPAFLAEDIFSWEPALWLLNSRDGEAEAVQKKSIAIFDKKQRLLSLDMKTKVVQHVPRIIFNIYKILKFQKGLLHLLSRCAANPYGHNSWWKWSKLNTTVIYHNMKLMTTDWSTIDPQMTWKTTYSHRMTCITISPYKQWDFSLYKKTKVSRHDLRIIKRTFQRRAEQLVLDFSEFSEFSLKFRGIRTGILRIRNHSTNTTSGLDKQILYTTYILLL